VFKGECTEKKGRESKKYSPDQELNPPGPLKKTKYGHTALVRYGHILPLTVNYGF
jgi:hypothetical protein